MAENINAGVVVVTKFCESNSKTFGEYINYIDRAEAKRNEMLSEYNLYNDYMDNPEKTTGLFTKDKIKLNSVEKIQLKDIFSKAQEKGSLMWQTVISFDNRWLEQYGLYDSKNRILDERKLKEIATGAVNRMLTNEGLNNAVWSGAIHYNTDNVHIHIATIEPEPSRIKKLYTVYEEKEVNGKKLKVPKKDENGNIVKRENYVGRFKGKSIEMCKQFVVSEITQQREQNLLINTIIRDNIVKQKQEHVLATDSELKDKFLDIYQCLPRVGNRGLWNYNNNAMNKVKPLLDDLITSYIKKYHENDYKEFLTELDKQDKLYKESYGKGSGRSYKESKIQDLYSRLGNKILRELKDYDKRTAGMEYNPEEAEAILVAFYESHNVEPDYEEEEIGGDIQNLDVVKMEWSKDYKLARKLIYGKEKNILAGMMLLQDEISKGNTLAFYELGNIYQKGVGTKIDLAKSNKYYAKAFEGFQKELSKADDKNTAYIKYRIGKMYYYELGVEKDLKQTFEYLKSAADSGNTYAAYTIANMYDVGDYVEVNKKEAINYYKKATQNKVNPYACLKLAAYYDKGEVVEKNLDKSREYYIKAYDKFNEFESDSPDANNEYRLGIMNLKGQGVEVNKEKAEFYLRQSAENGNSNAQYQLAKILMEKGENEYLQESLDMLSDAASNGNTMAQYSLGKIYFDKKSQYFDERKAFEYFSLAAKKHEFAEYSLANMYADIDSFCSDIDKAIHIYQKLAKKENEFARIKLLKIYSDIDSKYFDMDKALYYGELAYTQGNEFAAYRLGKIYSDKESQYYDVNKAVQRLTGIADEGNFLAQYRLGKIYLDSDSNYYNPDKAVDYLKMSGEQGNQYAYLTLGFLYYRGENVKEDKAEARKYFDKAAFLGNELAVQMIEKIDNPKNRNVLLNIRTGDRLRYRGAYDIERALNKLKQSFDTYFTKQRAIMMHERLLEHESVQEEKENVR